MEMPPFCSSGRRSVSLPVSARTSHVLPWSMWPAVPTVRGIEATLPRRKLPAMLRLLAWLVVAALLGAAAFELALARGAGSLGPEPGEDVPGADIVFAIGALATLVGSAVAA